MRFPLVRLGGMVALLLVIAIPAHAQRQVVQDDKDPHVMQQRAAACPVALEILATGRSARYRQVSAYPDSLQPAWAWSTVRECGPEGEQAIAAAMRRTARSADVKRLSGLTAATQKLRGPAVLSAALAIARDPGASVPARVLAMRTLAWAIRPELLIEYENYAGLGSRPCSGLGHPEARSTAAVPATANTEIVALARQLMAEPSTPARLRHAAMCTRMDLGDRDLPRPR